MHTWLHISGITRPHLTNNCSWSLAHGADNCRKFRKYVLIKTILRFCVRAVVITAPKVMQFSNL